MSNGESLLINTEKEEDKMLKITKVVCQSAAHMEGCGKRDDWHCGITVKNG